MDIMKMVLKTPASILHEEMAKKKLIPVYELVFDGTKTAQPLFTYRVTCDEESATGSGRCKKMAKQEAAMAMLRKFQLANSIPEIYTKPQNQNSAEEEALQPLLENACNKNESIESLLAVQRLMTLCLDQSLPEPEFSTAVSGPSHDPQYTVRCTVSDYVEEGFAQSKKVARRSSALKMINTLRAEKGILDNSVEESSKKKVNFNNQNKRNDGDDDMDDASKDADSSTTRSKIMPYGGVFNGSFKNNCDASKNEDSQTNIAETENMMRILRLRSMRGTVANNFNSTLNNDEEGSKMKYGKNNQSQEKEVKHDSDNIKPRRFSDFEMNKSNHEEEYIPKMKQQATLAAPLRRSDHTVFDNSSNFIQEAEAKNILNDEPPELVSTEELKQISLKGSVCSDEYVKIKLAEEVVVANVPEKFSALYILYLLENFDPISITEMKTIAQNGIRYCSVYFKSQKDAIAVEKKFDNFDLSGSKLIVRTPQLLINEVISD